MDNKLFSIVRRAMKITTSYIMSLIIFGVLTMTILGIAQENTPSVMPYFSFLIFLFLFYSIYVDMSSIAFKEKRPQYAINPSPFKGILYGAIGIVPVLVMQTAAVIIRVPEDVESLRRRILQVISGPLYWLAKILGNEDFVYLAATLVVVIIAFLGYYAGNREFYLLKWIRKKTGKKRT